MKTEVSKTVFESRQVGGKWQVNYEKVPDCKVSIKKT